MKTPGKKQMVEFYRQMLKIRMVEEKLMEIFSNGEIPGFIHVCIGQEAAPVAVCSHLKTSDYMANTHRGHGHAIAKGINLPHFLAELFGRRNGPCRGRSGSMHLADASLGILGANGIVGGGIPIATGAALSAKLRRTDQVTVCFFGEGATDEGTFHESLNIASVMNLPILFVCENNGWAEFTPQHVHMGIQNVSERASAYDMPGKTVSNDFLEIHDAAEKAVSRARMGQGPSLLEVQSRRWHGHFVGDAQKYRPSEDIDRAMASDCIALFRDHLIRSKVLTEAVSEKITKSLLEEIEDAVSFARQSEAPDPSELTEDLWA